MLTTEVPLYFLLPCTLVLGLVIGSFLNVVIYRLPIMLQRQWKADCSEFLEIENPDKNQTPFNLVTPNSTCPHCNTAIKPWQNIPLLSYAILKGECGNCGAGISARYPFVEALTGVLSLLLAWYYGFGPELTVMLLFTWALVALTFIDIDHKLLPDSITLPLLWAGLLVNSQGVMTDLTSAVFGAMAGYLSLWSVYWAFKLLTGKEGMGFGDFKLLAALGAWFGWQYLPLTIILSSCVGAVLGIISLKLQGKENSEPIPFGPYLAIAGWIAAVWGEPITQSYLQFAGFNP